MKGGRGEAHVARRALYGLLYSTGGSSVTLSLGLLRTVLLTRLLAPADFGVSELALFFTGLATQPFFFGFDAAFVQRVGIEAASTGTYVTLRLAAQGAALTLLALAMPVVGSFYPDMPNLAAVAFGYAAAGTLLVFNAMQEAMLRRQLEFGRVAATNVLSSLTMTVVAPLLAWHGWGIWSLVAEQVCGQLARTAVLWGVYRPLRLRPAWDPAAARTFWEFGKGYWIESNLSLALDRFDDFWTGTRLGKNALGLYSRAFAFSGYNRRVVGNPVLSVFFPTFARLQRDRLRLSQAFFRSSFFVVRAGFLVAALLVLCAPELVRLLLGPQWVPMVTTFQLMGIYMVCDPVVRCGGSLLSAVGRPDLLARARVVQAGVFVPAVVVFAEIWHVEGVAAAADLMMLTGALALFRACRQFVDFSAVGLFGRPLLALAVAAALVLAAGPRLAGLPLPLALAAKMALTVGLYAGVLGALEARRLRPGLAFVWRHLRGRGDERENHHRDAEDTEDSANDPWSGISR